MSNLEYAKELAPESPEWVHEEIAFQLGRRDAEIERLREALRKCLDLMHNGGTWDIGEQHRMAALAGKEEEDD